MPRDTAEIFSFANAREVITPPNVASLEPTLFAHPGVGFAVKLTWDRAGRRHVATVFDHRTVGRTYEASDGWETNLHVICWDTFASGPEAA